MDEDRLRELLGRAELELWMREYTRSLMQHVKQRDEERIETDITDADMVRLHIDIALRNGDKEQFMTLTEQLRELVHN